ncbi:TPA: lysis system o-spanin lipoprotein Rz1, partial [Providencia alcalifaciens]
TTTKSALILFIKSMLNIEMNYQMQKLKLTSYVLLLSVILSGCTSEQVVRKAKPIPPPAWMMEQPPDLLTPLSEIIGYSDNESQSQGK